MKQGLRKNLLELSLTFKLAGWGLNATSLVLLLPLEADYERVDRRDMIRYTELRRELSEQPRTWLVTGVAGFIGSHLLETLLSLDQNVTGLDNFSTGYRRNIDYVKRNVSPAQWARFRLINGDITDIEHCRRAVSGVDFVLHQAALGSVPRSIEDPIASNNANITGFLNMLDSARRAGVKNFVYAASSSSYGDHPALPKFENTIGNPLSPYAVTKQVNELYASVFDRVYDFKTIGLRYFNVFGARQDPNGAYAAVIPKWIAAMIERKNVIINGDGENSRDFCYIENVIQANLLSATTQNANALGQVYNVAVGASTSLRQLYFLIRDVLEKDYIHLGCTLPTHAPFRAGDVRHSLADISKARSLLGYEPTHRIDEGLAITIPWYVAHRSA